MVNYSSETLDRSLYALSDPTRRAMLARMAQSEMTVSELAEPFAISLAAVSKHLQVLERAQFIKKTKWGRNISCRATLDPLKEVMALLEDLGRYWNLQLDSLEQFLAKNIDDKGTTHEHAKERKSAVPNSKTSNSRKKRKGI